MVTGRYHAVVAPARGEQRRQAAVADVAHCFRRRGAERTPYAPCVEPSHERCERRRKCSGGDSATLALLASSQAAKYLSMAGTSSGNVAFSRAIYAARGASIGNSNSGSRTMS